MSKSRFFTLKHTKRFPEIVSWLVALIMRVYAKTLKISYVGSEHISEDSFSVAIFAMWHNRIPLLPPTAPELMCKKCTVLVSSSRDGEYIAGVVRQFGVEPVRGSSSHGAAQALMDLAAAIRNGRSPVITLDGPRGPRYMPHQGAVVLAMQHNVPIIPFSLNFSSYWQFKSWDRMQLPKPFSKVEFLIGKPLYIPQGTPRDQALDMLQNAMDDITKD